MNGCGSLMVQYSHAKLITGGWEGGGGGWGAVGRLKQTFKHKWQYCAISIGDPDWHNSHGEPGVPSESVWHPMQSY